MIEAAEQQTYSFAEFEVDAKKRLLFKNAQAVALNSKTFDLLLVLIENRGQIVSKDELLGKVWEGQFVEENNLTVQVSTLRKIFGEKKGEHRFIATIPGKGYKFVADLKDQTNEIVIENHTISRVVVEDSEIKTPPETRRLNAEPNFPKKHLIAAAAVLLIVSVAFGFWVWTKNQTSLAPIESIAVMPFIYEGGNIENEYLSDGITESLINNLSQLPKLTVKARASVFHYKGKDFDANKVGNELSVQAILLGRIIERGDQFILSLELVDAKTNNHLWGEQYTRKKVDLATLQNEIARDVSAKLRQKLTGGEPLQKGQTANSEAYQLYLKGRFLWNKRRHEDHLKAIAAFEQAIALDPNFALAYAALGDVYTVNSFKMADEERDAKGRATALKALEIEPNLAEAYPVLAKIEWNSFKRAEAESYFKRAVELGPNYASAHEWYAEFLIQQVRIEEAIAEIRRALELDPLSPIINSDAVFIYTMARQEDNAIAQANKMLELDANWYRAYEWRAAANEAKGDYAAALADFEKANELSDKANDKKEQIRKEFELVREAFEKSGEQKGYWQKSLEIVKGYPPEKAGYYFVAVCYTKLGDKEKALDSLEKAFEKKEYEINLMKVEPYFDNLQAEPRFQSLLRKIGL
jgi:DNA-binding winged helix-turn-helix (wHTH) protein/TolB-like protein/Tfp pilus assembly protein PilF